MVYLKVAFQLDIHLENSKKLQEIYPLRMAVKPAETEFPTTPPDSQNQHSS